MRVVKSKGACGAQVLDVDLSSKLNDQQISEIRSAFIEHHVLAFHDQILTNDDLERFSLYFGEFSGDPYLPTLEGSEHIVELRREANETSTIFADSWHSDWSFGKQPPTATILYSVKVPPVGGNTDFINQQKAWRDIPLDLKNRLEKKVAIHSASAAYSPSGLYADGEDNATRSMKIIISDTANELQQHPLITTHPESGKRAIFGCFGYIVGLQDTDKEEEAELLGKLYEWQTQVKFQYSHQWQDNMLVMWDNRSVLHKATGGYEGHDRVLHRTVVS